MRCLLTTNENAELLMPASSRIYYSWYPHGFQLLLLPGALSSKTLPKAAGVPHSINDVCHEYSRRVVQLPSSFTPDWGRGCTIYTSHYHQGFAEGTGECVAYELIFQVALSQSLFMYPGNLKKKKKIKPADGWLRTTLGDLTLDVHSPYHTHAQCHRPSDPA